mmetsp:Transcript_200/g.554  ORF Transcript_200/g.554 Transcript_200/m.554 type:complete len:241 (-) Transcript_200:335-1057(-)
MKARGWYWRDPGRCDAAGPGPSESLLDLSAPPAPGGAPLCLALGPTGGSVACSSDELLPAEPADERGETPSPVADGRIPCKFAPASCGPRMGARGPAPPAGTVDGCPGGSFTGQRLLPSLRHAFLRAVALIPRAFAASPKGLCANVVRTSSVMSTGPCVVADPLFALLRRGKIIDMLFTPASLPLAPGGSHFPPSGADGAWGPWVASLFEAPHPCGLGMSIGRNPPSTCCCCACCCCGMW